MTNFYLEDHDWDMLLKRIELGKIVPFLGAGACFNYVPMAKEIAEKWSEKYKYPGLLDRENLVEVAQHIGIRFDKSYPNEDFVDTWLNDYKIPPYENRDEIHGVLADLPISTFITTNYDDLMVRALRHNNREPVQEICRWKSTLREDETSAFEGPDGYEPTIKEPLVFHLHGYKDNPSSMVLTEDDYMDFLLELANLNEADTGSERLIPSVVQKVFKRNTVLFIGYSFKDINFRIIFRSLLKNLPRSDSKKSFIIQYSPSYDDTSLDNTAEDYADQTKEMSDVKDYLTDYYGDINIKFVHATASAFAQDLHRRWQEYKNKKA